MARKRVTDPLIRPGSASGRLKKAEALALLRDSSIPYKPEMFGFSIEHRDFDGTDTRFAECGMDNDYSISLAVVSDGERPVEWFWRYDFLEMANFVVGAYSKCGENPTRAQIVENLRLLDSEYDYDGLRVRLDHLSGL